MLFRSGVGQVGDRRLAPGCGRLVNDGVVDSPVEVFRRCGEGADCDRRAGLEPFGQNLTYDCHAVHTTARVRTELGLRPRYTLAAGLAGTLEWYLREGLDKRAIDFGAEDALLRSLGAR